MFDRSAVDGDDDDVDVDVDGSYKDTRHSALLSQSTANGHVSSVLPPLLLYHPAPHRPFIQGIKSVSSFAIQCLRIAANIAQFVVIIQDIEPHNVRRHHQFQNVDGYAKTGEREREKRKEGGFGNPIRCNQRLLLHTNRARQAKEEKETERERERRGGNMLRINRVEFFGCYRYH